ncbi:hypothetical protein Tco_1472382, partial [Tanacetum coccineum]
MHQTLMVSLNFGDHLSKEAELTQKRQIRVFFSLLTYPGLGRDVMIVVASVLIGGGVTSDDGLVDETSVKGAITGGVDVTV